jgi:hypothetical protein
MSDYATLEKLLRIEQARSREPAQSRYNMLLAGARGQTRVLTDDPADFLTTSGTLTIASYGISMAAGGAVVGGLADVVIAALVDQDLLADITCVELDGTAAVAITADGLDKEVALCLVIVNGALALRGVFSAEAAVGTAVPPTPAQCRAALKAAAEANYADSGLGMVVARIKIVRSAVDTVTMVHTSAATDDGLAGERAAGALA